MNNLWLVIDFNRSRCHSCRIWMQNKQLPKKKMVS